MTASMNKDLKKISPEKRRTWTAWLAAALLLLALPLPALAATSDLGAQSDLSAQDIERAIEQELFRQAGVSFHTIDVAVAGDIVTLSGSTATLLAKERAVDIAEATRGVAAVVDTLKVRSSERSDEAIRADVIDALLNDPAADSYEIQAEVENGWVTLRGEVDSWQEKELSARVAKSVRGITGITNEIDVVYSEERPDHEIQAEIERRLDWDVRIDDALVDVAVDDGAVTLSGIVGSAAEKSQARVLAWTAGVTSVDASAIAVESWARDERFRKDKYVERSDEDIERAVRDAFLYDPRVFSFEPEVDVEQGVVTLTGVVDNLKAKFAAGQDARNTVGVWRVKNLLKVRPSLTPSDAEIAESIESALARDPFTESYEISVAVTHGEANLYGLVDSFFEKMRAASVAAGVTGVLEVDNHLEVESPVVTVYDPSLYPWERMSMQDVYSATTLEDWEIREEVEDQLYWSPFVDSDEVNVTVDNGIVTLTGHVDTWSERRAASENAWEGGAHTVVNELLVAEGAPSWLR